MTVTIPDPTILIAWLVLLLGLPLNLYVVQRLWRLARQSPANRVVRDRAIVATAVLLLVIVFGGVFVSNDWVPPVLPLIVTKYITRLTVLVVAVVPAVYWVRLYRNWS